VQGQSSGVDRSVVRLEVELVGQGDVGIFRGVGL